ncbi:MAG: hypothetical protein ABIM99_06580 [Candidatus Dojkabacteria bacterium]
MKINSRKFLVFAHSLSGKPILYAHLAYLWPELSEGGRRGLVAHLVKQRLISVTYKGKQAQLSLSSIGQAWIEEEFFSRKRSVEPGSLVLVYPEVQLSEPKYKALRRILASEMMELSARTYYTQFPLSEELFSTLKRKYFSLAALVTLREWAIGDQNIFSNYYLQKNSEYVLQSGISSQIKQLIDKKTSFTDANHQSNVAIFSFFDRLFTFIEENRSYEMSKNTEGLSCRELLAIFSELF